MQANCNTIRRHINQNKTVTLAALPNGSYRLLEVIDLPWGQTELSSAIFHRIDKALLAYTIASAEVM